MPSVFYKEGYKYQLSSDYWVQLPVKGYNIKHDYFTLLPSGVLTISKGYAWDGATSFPDINTIIRGSLVHDCLYQMIRLKFLPSSRRDEADGILRQLCLEDGMNSALAWAVYRGVRLFASKAANGPDKSMKKAP